MNNRAEIERKIQETLANKDIKIYDWMFDLGLKSTEIIIYAKIFQLLKDDSPNEKLIDTRQMIKDQNISQSQFNNIMRTLHRKGIVFRRVEGRGCKAKSYYSLYENLFNNGGVQNT